MSLKRFLMNILYCSQNLSICTEQTLILYFVKMNMYQLLLKDYLYHTLKWIIDKTKGYEIKVVRQ